jgi:N-acetyl-gamma-glutamyl-phosphate reductase
MWLFKFSCVLIVQIARLLATHPFFKITMMTADRKAGQQIADVFPHLCFKPDLPDLVAIRDADFNTVDAVFCCLPHATTQARVYIHISC